MLEWSSEDGWWGDPKLCDIPADSGLTCPECRAAVLHVQPVLVEVLGSTVGSTVGQHFTAWLLVPCQHEVSVKTHMLWRRGTAMSFEPN